LFNVAGHNGREFPLIPASSLTRQTATFTHKSRLDLGLLRPSESVYDVVLDPAVFNLQFKVIDKLQQYVSR